MLIIEPRRERIFSINYIKLPSFLAFISHRSKREHGNNTQIGETCTMDWDEVEVWIEEVHIFLLIEEVHIFLLNVLAVDNPVKNE